MGLEVHQGAGALTLEGDQAGRVGVAQVGGLDVAVEVGVFLVLTVGQPGAAQRFGFLALGLGHLVVAVGLLRTLGAERAVCAQGRDDAGVGAHLDAVGPVVHDGPVPVVEARGQVVQELEVAPHRTVHDASGAGELDVELVAVTGVGGRDVLGVVVADVRVVEIVAAVAVVGGLTARRADADGNVAGTERQGQQAQGDQGQGTHGWVSSSLGGKHGQLVICPGPSGAHLRLFHAPEGIVKGCPFGVSEGNLSGLLLKKCLQIPYLGSDL